MKFQPTALMKKTVFYDDRCVMWIDRNLSFLKDTVRKTQKKFQRET